MNACRGILRMDKIRIHGMAHYISRSKHTTTSPRISDLTETITRLQHWSNAYVNNTSYLKSMVIQVKQGESPPRYVCVGEDKERREGRMCLAARHLFFFDSI